MCRDVAVTVDTGKRPSDGRRVESRAALLSRCLLWILCLSIGMLWVCGDMVLEKSL